MSIQEAERAAAALIASKPNLGNADLVLMKSTAAGGEWALLYVSFEEGTCKRRGQVVRRSAVDADRRLCKAAKTMTSVSIVHIGTDGKVIGWLSR
jgi:hypothetical protein